MLKIVSNTTPLLNLLKISQFNLLQKLYGKIYLPYGVYEELEEGKDRKYYLDISSVKWIELVKIQNQQMLDYLIDLDQGEAETIILAKEIAADLVIIDEKIGRLYAKHYNLKITGTLGILLKAKEKGYLKTIKPLLFDLKSKHTWISNQLILEVLKMAKEK